MTNIWDNIQRSFHKKSKSQMGFIFLLIQILNLDSQILLASSFLLRDHFWESYKSLQQSFLTTRQFSQLLLAISFLNIDFILRYSIPNHAKMSSKLYRHRDNVNKRISVKINVGLRFYLFFFFWQQALSENYLRFSNISKDQVMARNNSSKILNIY